MRSKSFLALSLALIFCVTCALADMSQPPAGSSPGTKSSFSYAMYYSHLEAYYESFVGYDIDDCGIGPVTAPATIGPYFSVDLDHCRVYCRSEDAHIAGLAAVLFDFNNSDLQNLSCWYQLFNIIAALEFDQTKRDGTTKNAYDNVDYEAHSAIEALWEETMYPTFAQMKIAGEECALLHRGRYNYYAVMLSTDQALCIAICDGFQFGDNAFGLHVAILNADIAALQKAKAATTDPTEAGQIEVSLLRKQLELAELLYQ